MVLKQLFTGAEFLVSAGHPDDLPTDQGREVAFAGRSNAGKSSVLNKICSRKQLARTSKMPGRTQLINFFSLSSNTRLVDLPGYGYAKASQDKQRQWTELLEYYFSTRQSLVGTIVVMDIRHPLRDTDRQMVEWCANYGYKSHILLNKADKLSKNKAKNQLLAVRNDPLFQSQYSITAQIFSASTGEGLPSLMEKIGNWLDLK